MENVSRPCLVCRCILVYTSLIENGTYHVSHTQFFSFNVYILRVSDVQQMNLAARCRQAMQHVEILKKELVMHQQKSVQQVMEPLDLRGYVFAITNRCL